MVKLKELIFENGSVEFLTENPIKSITQGLHTRKIIKSLTPDEKKVLGQFVRDKDFIERARVFHTSDPNYRKGARNSMAKYVRDRLEDPNLADKIVQITQDPKFDVARNRVMTKLLVPKTELPKTDEPLSLTVKGQKAAAAAEKRKANYEKQERERQDKFKQSQLSRAKLEKWTISTKIKNPKTGRMVQIRSALQTDPDSQLYKLAFQQYATQTKALGLPEPKPTTKLAYNMSRTLSGTKSSSTPSLRPVDADSLDDYSDDDYSFSNYSDDDDSDDSSFGGFGGGGGFSGGGGGISF